MLLSFLSLAMCSPFDDFPEDFMDDTNDTGESEGSQMQLDPDDDLEEGAVDVDTAPDSGTFSTAKNRKNSVSGIKRTFCRLQACHKKLQRTSQRAKSQRS